MYEDYKKEFNEDKLWGKLKKAFSNNEINGTTIMQYAKKLKCEKKIKAIMEVMI